MPTSPLLDWQRRPGRALALVIRFGGAGLIAGFTVGFSQGRWEGALVCGFAGGMIGTATGGLARLLACLISRLPASRVLTGYLDRPVRRPALWGSPLACEACGWHTTPDGPCRIRDCTSPPVYCPTCGHRVSRVPVPCPGCGTVCHRRFRWPKSLRQTLWGGEICAVCGCEFDKWGRELRV